MTTQIVITGAPGSGKTALIERLRADAAFAGFLFFDELARELLEQRPDFRTRWAEFHQEIYRQQVGREDDAVGKSFITDRGTVDAFAFHPETLQDVGTTLEREYARYTAVIQLGTTARLGEQYYQTDAVRQESVYDALVIERALMTAWGKHPNYRFIDACDRWDDKVDACRKALDRLIQFETGS